MNGFIVASLESGLLLCSSSFVGTDFGLSKIGSDHLHLSSTLFALYTLARGDGSVYMPQQQQHAFNQEPPPQEQVHSEFGHHGGHSHLPLPFPLQDDAVSSSSQRDRLTDTMCTQQTRGLSWVRFASIFLSFWEISGARPASGNATENSNFFLLVLIHRNTLQRPDETAFQLMLSAFESEVTAQNTSAREISSSSLAPFKKGDNFDWIKTFFDLELRKLYNSGIESSVTTTQTIRRIRHSSATKSTKPPDLDRKYWEALQEMSGDNVGDNVGNQNRRESGANGEASNHHKENQQKEYTPHSFLEVLSNIPMRLIQALTRKKNTM